MNELVFALLVGVLNLNKAVQDLATRVAALEASKPTSFVIRDATGVELGPVVGIDGVDVPKTILQYPGGRLVPVSVHRDRVASLEIWVVFSGTNCSGTAYIDAGGTGALPRTVVAGPGATLYVATGPDLAVGVPYQSMRHAQAGCINQVGTTASPHTEAEIISYWSNLQPPFSVHRK
jgi:hypothetical protein